MIQDTMYDYEVPKQIFSLLNLFKSIEHIELFITILKEGSISQQGIVDVSTGHIEPINPLVINDLMRAGVVTRIGELSEDNYKQFYVPTEIGKLVMKKLVEAVLFIED